MSCEHAHLDGAYVLGSLSPAERQEFERHLGTCDECSRNVRELAGLPGLLSRVDRSVLELGASNEAVPPTLLPSLVREVRRRRRRTVLLAAGAAAAAAVVAAGVPLALSGGDDRGRTPSGPQVTATSSPTASQTPDVVPVAMDTVGGAPVRGSLAFESVGWGTKLDLECTYTKSGDGGGGYPGHGSDGGAVKYEMFVHTDDGEVEQVGTWHASEGATMRLTAATAASRADIVSVVVRTAEGQPVLRLKG